MKFYIVVIVSVLSFSLKGQQFNQRIDSLVKANQKKYSIPGLSIAVVSHDKTLYQKSFGVKNINTTQAVDENTVFHTASLSKLFTAQAVMDLIDKDSFLLDDKIIALLPDFEMSDPRYVDITVKHLLTHTSGMPDITNYHWADDRNDPDALKKYFLSLSSVKLNSEPGKTFEYSSMDYDVLGYLIERITRTPFSEYMKLNILEPFGMTRSNFDYFKTDSALRCSPHTRGIIFKIVHTRKTYPYNPAHAPSSTLNSTSNELALWMKGLLNILHTGENQGNLRASTFHAMLKPTENFSFVGLGWFIGERFGIKTYYHFGGDRGFRSYLILIPEYDLGLVLLANCDYGEDFRQEILHGAAGIVIKNRQQEK